VESRNEKTEKSQHFSISAFQHFGRRGQSALSARADGIPDELVRAFPFRSLLWKWSVRRLAAQKRSHEAYLQTDAAFASAVARLKLQPHDVFFGYSYASLEMLEAEKKRGVLTVLDQIDPGAAEFKLVAEEMSRFPELAGPSPEFPAAYYERNQREWALADRIVVNSEWSRNALVKQGVAPEKLFVMPLCYEANAEKQKAESRDLQPSTFNPQPLTTPLRVLFLGQVNVRKGIHYLMQAAKLLANEPVRFDVVGSIGILPGAVASAPRNMTFHGPVSRGGAAEWYRKSDLFVLPTISDGFAITQLEAMSHGLPVITTLCCGEVVRDGVDGFIVPPRDADALARLFLRYLAEPELLREQQQAALTKAKQFTLERLAENLGRLEAALGDGSTESKAKSRK
jgi:glycosyltransferase involved in cell wall biosynthesis